MSKEKLLRADPDTVPSDPALRRFAVSRGEPAFVAHCAVCHGVSGAGDPVKGVPNLTDNDWLYGTGRVADIEQIIEYGIRSHNSRAWSLAIMPAYARPHPNPADQNIRPLSPGEIGDLVEFLFRQQGRAADTRRRRGEPRYTAAMRAAMTAIPSMPKATPRSAHPILPMPSPCMVMAAVMLCINPSPTGARAYALRGSKS